MVLADPEHIDPQAVRQLDLLYQVSKALPGADRFAGVGVGGPLREGVDAKFHGIPVFRSLIFYPAFPAAAAEQALVPGDRRGHNGEVATRRRVLVRAAVLIGVSQTGNLQTLKAVHDGVRAMERWALGQGIDRDMVKVLSDEEGPVEVPTSRRRSRRSST